MCGWIKLTNSFTIQKNGKKYEKMRKIENFDVKISTFVQFVNM